MGVIWRRWPFKSFRDIYPDHASNRGHFHLTPTILNELNNPPPIPTITPDENDLAILWAHYPNSDPAAPPWGEIEADLIVGGISRADIKELTCKQLLLLLDRVHTAPATRDM